MKKSFILFSFILLPMISLLAQEEETSNWKKGGTFSLNMSQVSLTNWVAGGENSVSGNLLFNSFINYKKDNVAWDNTFDLGYGLVKQGEKSTRKSDDKIELSSKLGIKASNKWYYSGLLNFRTQMTPGYKYSDDLAVEDLQISGLFAPAYLNLAFGMDYKPNDNFSAMLSPLSGKMTFVSDTAFSVDYGLDAGTKLRSEFGAYAKLSYKHDIMKNVALSTKVDLFSNYFNNPQNVDVNWEVLISFKVNKYISANLNTTLLYDDDILIADEQGKLSPRVQFKEVFGFGLTVKF